MLRPIKILFTIPNFDTAGSGKVVYDLVKGLDRSKFAPQILVKHTRGEFFKEVEKLAVPIHVFDYETPYKPLWNFPMRVFKVSRYLKNLEIDIIHSWHWSSDFSEPLAARLAGIKFIYTKKAMGWGNKAWVWRSKLSNKIIAINKDMMKEFFDPIPSVDAVYLPLGLDTEVYQPQNYHRPTAVRHGIVYGDFVVVSVVNMVPVKGIEILIDAFLMADIPNKKLLLVGNDQSEYVDQLKLRYCKEHPEVIFTGKQLEVRNYLSIADVFVIPTKDEGKREGMPMAPVEAMSSALPVIGSKVSGVSDILEGFEEWIFKPSDSTDLAEKLLNFYELPKEKRAEIGAAMRDKVIDHYSFDDFIKSREEIYDSL